MTKDELREILGFTHGDPDESGWALIVEFVAEWLTQEWNATYQLDSYQAGDILADAWREEME